MSSEDGDLYGIWCIVVRALRMEYIKSFRRNEKGYRSLSFFFFFFIERMKMENNIEENKKKEKGRSHVMLQA